MFKNLVKDLVQVAFDVVGDLKDTVNYVQFTSGEYDTELSEMTITYDYDVGVQALFTKFAEQERSDEVNAFFDRKVLIPAKQLTIVLDQASNDMILDSSNKLWNVYKYLGIVGDSLHTFHVKAA